VFSDDELFILNQHSVDCKGKLHWRDDLKAGEVGPVTAGAALELPLSVPKPLTYHEKVTVPILPFFQRDLKRRAGEEVRQEEGEEAVLAACR
jgi:hypothetical protein